MSDFCLFCMANLLQVTCFQRKPQELNGIYTGTLTCSFQNIGLFVYNVLDISYNFLSCQAPIVLYVPPDIH